MIDYNIQDFQYQISLYCPGECVNCSIWKYDKYEITKDEIEVEDFESVIQSKVLENVEYIQLTAGEVQLSPKYARIVKLIAKHKPKAFIHTNISGWYPQKHYSVTKECLEVVSPDNFRIDISLDGRKETYEKIRLVKNGYDKVFETLKLLKTLNCKIRLVFTIYKENYQDMEWLINIANEYQVDYYFEFVRESNFLNNFGSTTFLNFTEDELVYIENILSKSDFIKREDRYIKWERAKQIYKGKNLPFSCHMGKTSIVLDPNGNVYPCIEALDMLNMGNVKDYDNNLDELLQSDNSKNVLKLIKDKKCQPCGMLCLQEIGVESDLV